MEDAGIGPKMDLADLTTEIVSAYVGHNAVQAADLPGLIAAVHTSLASLGKPVEEPVADTKVSSGEIRKSIKPDALISFIDGKPYKTLKRHLTRHGMSGAEYRTKYGLPADYPLVAASYAAQRSALAKSLGLGQIRKGRSAGEETEAPAAEDAAPADDAPAQAPRRRGRPKKAEAA